MATSGAAAASADLDSGRWLSGDLAVVRRDGLRLLLPVILWLQGRQGDHGRVLGRDGTARQAEEPLSRRLPAIRRRRRKPPARLRPLFRGGRIFLRPLPARRCALGDTARLYERGQPTGGDRKPDTAGGGRQCARQGDRRTDGLG